MTDIIEAAAMRCRTMADGSLRIECEIEPGNAQAAFKLFGMPGAPMAIAALKVGHAKKSDEPEPQAPEHARESPQTPAEDRKGGPLAKLAGMWCQSKDFQDWLGVPTSAEAKLFILEECGIDSRAELDHNQKAAEIFHRNIREPYSNWLTEIGKAP